MTVKDLYQDAIIWKYHSLKLVIEYLVFERKVLQMTDDEEKLMYYFQDKFANKMNEYLLEYIESRERIGAS